MKHILVVDDDSSVLKFLAHALGDYRVSVARDPDEALNVARSISSLDLIVTDYLMPSMTGDELIARLREQRPSLKVLILTGHSVILDVESPPWWVTEAHLAKPMEIEALRGAVAQLIGPP
jgi:CheY-like chemotaxis protein